jgi:hypothetical protein
LPVRILSKPSGQRLSALALLLAVAPAAMAQEAAPLAQELMVGVRCSEARAAEDLEFRIKRMKATPDEVDAALRALAANASTCEPVRAAALAFVGEEAPAAEAIPAAAEEDNTEAARAIASQTLAEADRRAQALKFEVGPPPRHMTRGRKSGQ